MNIVYKYYILVLRVIVKIQRIVHIYEEQKIVMNEIFIPKLIVRKEVA